MPGTKVDFCVLSEVVQVISAYESTGPEQLTIERGQLIHVQKKSPTGWWEGELQVGIYSHSLHVVFSCWYLLNIGHLWVSSLCTFK